MNLYYLDKYEDIKHDLYKILTDAKDRHDSVHKILNYIKENKNIIFDLNDNK